MVKGAPSWGPAITFADDPRITRDGRFLRASKIAELPQLINVLVGDMSLVRPRPEVEQYVSIFRSDYEKILQVRPGITDPASIESRNESEILGRAVNPEEEYVSWILPKKIRLSKQYVRQMSLGGDARVLMRTIVSLFRVLPRGFARNHDHTESIQGEKV